MRGFKADGTPYWSRGEALTSLMDNVLALKLGRALGVAEKASYGDSIDRGLSLRKALEDEGFEVRETGVPALAGSTPQANGEDGAEGEATILAEGLEILAGIARPPIIGDHVTRLNEVAKEICRRAASMLRTRPAATAQVPTLEKLLRARYTDWPVADNEAATPVENLYWAIGTYVERYRAAPATPKGGVVDEDMTDRAIDAWDDTYDGVSHNKREAMRAALTAALAQQEPRHYGLADGEAASV